MFYSVCRVKIFSCFIKMLSEYNFNTRIFSTEYWNVLYCVAFSMKESNKTKVKAFFNNVFIPCNQCQLNYENYLSSHPLTDIQTHTEMVQWLFNLHNEIRSSKGLALLDFNYTLTLYNNHHSNSLIYDQLNQENSNCPNC